MTPLEWLKKQREVAVEDFEKAKRKLESIDEVLVLAAQERIPIQPHKVKAERATQTILDVAEEVLLEHGPLSISFILHWMQEKGKATNSHTLGKMLQRSKGKRFGHDKANKKWFSLKGKISTEAKVALDKVEEGLRPVKTKTILDIAEEILQELGPSTIDDILHAVLSRGRGTTKASLTTLLHNGKPHRFNRDEHSNRWYAVNTSPAEEIRYLNV